MQCICVLNIHSMTIVFASAFVCAFLIIMCVYVSLNMYACMYVSLYVCQCKLVSMCVPVGLFVK